MTPRTARTAGYAAVLATACAVALAGCGIRSTAVPVDAGAAPSRVACVLPGDGTTTTVPQGTIVRIHLVCGARVTPVERVVRMPPDPLAVPQALLDEIASPPDRDEVAAGFATAVPEDLAVGAGGPGDPAGTLRLSQPLEDLPPFAVAQIVCTYAGTSIAAGNGSVVLGGPAGDGAEPLRRFTCDSALRNSPDAAGTAGVPV